MAFNLETLVRIGGQRQAQAIYTYETDDDLATILASGYFDNARFDFTKRDYVFVHSNADSVDYILLITSETNARPVTVQLGSILENAGQATGWVQISDNTYTSGSPFAITAGVRTKLDLNSDSVIETYAPVGTTAADFYDPTTKKLYGQSQGGAYIFRLGFKVQPSAQNTFFDLELDIGGSQGVILARSASLIKGTAVSTYNTTNLYYTLQTFNANGGELYITPTTGNLNIWDMTLVISKVHRGSPI